VPEDESKESPPTHPRGALGDRPPAGQAAGLIDSDALNRSRAATAHSPGAVPPADAPEGPGAMRAPQTKSRPGP
jgi:hypothetical protein